MSHRLRMLPAALVVAVGLCISSHAQAQQNDAAAQPETTTLTPEMWYYQQQMQRYDDPKQAIRRRAEFKAQQRMARMATLRWYGFSNARPTATPVPMMTMYSPAWQSNFHRPHAWYTGRRTTIVVTQPAR